MEYTKGKCEAVKDLAAFVIYSDDFDIITVVDTDTGDDRANAERIAECWNAHDDLIKQRDALLGACKATSTWITLKTASHCTCGKTDVTRKNIRKGLDDAIAGAEK